MKQLLSISLAFFYLLISLGVGLNLHFCGGEVEGIQLLAMEQTSCCCAGSSEATSKANSCCYNEAIAFQQVTENAPRSVVTVVIKMFKALVPYTLGIADFFLVDVGSSPFLLASSPEAPPLLSSGQSLRLSLCSLVFYA